MKLGLAAILLGIALTGCAGARDGGVGIGKSFVGQPFDAFVTRFGIPQSSQKLSDGRTVYEWTDRHGIARTGAPIEGLLMAGSKAEVQGGSYQLACKVRMTVGRSGVIEDFVVAGDTIGAWQLSRCEEVFHT